MAMVLTGCVPLATRPRLTEEQAGALFNRSTLDDAAYTVPFRVLRPSYLPSGARLREVDYSLRPLDSFVIQRYEVGEHLLIIIAEPSEQAGPVRGPIAAQVQVLGRPAALAAIPRPDGGIGDWRIVWELGPVTYTVEGDIAAEELLKVAGGLR